MLKAVGDGARDGSGDVVGRKTLLCTLTENRRHLSPPSGRGIRSGPDTVELRPCLCSEARSVSTAPQSPEPGYE